MNDSVGKPNERERVVRLAWRDVKSRMAQVAVVAGGGMVCDLGMKLILNTEVVV